MQKRFLLGLMTLGLAGVFSQADAQTIETYDFDDGTTQGFASITRPDTYDDEPTAVTTDADFPAAFPPPSGTHALRVADDDENSAGLASAVSDGATFDRTAVDFSYAILRAEIYVVESTSGTEGNVALLAINDGTGTENEQYYRFGYRNEEVYLQKFDGATFPVLGQDANLDDDEMTIPGWNTFELEFVGADQIICRVNGVEASFSPVDDTEAGIDEEIQIGVLGFNFTSFNPILADDFYKEIGEPNNVEDWLMY